MYSSCDIMWVDLSRSQLRKTGKLFFSCYFFMMLYFCCFFVINCLLCIYSFLLTFYLFIYNSHFFIQIVPFSFFSCSCSLMQNTCVFLNLLAIVFSNFLNVFFLHKIWTVIIWVLTGYATLFYIMMQE